MADLVKILLSFSEQAGEVARAVREEPQLFSLLVEEKGEEEKNQRFAHDFKTLADVLIQEGLRHHIAQHFPVLSDHVQGEESAEFTNTLGETITVQICPTHQETAHLLAKVQYSLFSSEVLYFNPMKYTVLDGNKEAAEILATLLHSKLPSNEEPELENIPDLPVENLGIWIDPIDSTGEYVKGEKGTATGDIWQKGLPCVTVLIGLYDRTSGLPIGGVVNQPFNSFDDEKQRWKGKAYWGVSWGGTRIHNLPVAPDGVDGSKKLVAVVSSSENSELLAKMESGGITVIFATGAGYKVLAVVLGLCDTCLSSKGSTFRWDTAAPHALLEALEGGVVNYKLLREHHASKGVISAEDLKKMQIRYHQPNHDTAQQGQLWSNASGFVAYRNPSVLSQILACFK